MSERILTADEDDPAARIGPVLDALQRGDIVALPTETVYGLAARCEDSRPLSLRHSALESLKGARGEKPLSVAVSSGAAAEDLASFPPAARRLAERFWPGPLTLVLPQRGGGPDIGIRVPAHRHTTTILERLGTPVYLTSANRSGQAVARSAEEIIATFSEDEVVLALASRAPMLEEPSAVVRFDGERAIVLRGGLIDEAMILRVAATKVLIVCTGNTCRSPMAELLFRTEWARALGIDPHRLLEHGGLVGSAGVAAVPGIRASHEAIEVMSTQGLDLRSHRSQSIDAALLAAADHIFAMTASHRAALLAACTPQTVESVAGRTQLLDPEGEDVPDPIGGTFADYRKCADRIARAVKQRVRELVDGLQDRR